MFRTCPFGENQFLIAGKERLEMRGEAKNWRECRNRCEDNQVCDIWVFDNMGIEEQNWEFENQGYCWLYQRNHQRIQTEKLNGTILGMKDCPAIGI